MANVNRVLWLPSRGYLLSFVVIHATSSVGAFLACFSQSMGRFDTGGPATAFENVACTTAAVLLSPIATLMVRWEFAPIFFPGLLGYIPVLANSLLWAVAARWLLALARRRWHKPVGPPTR